MKLKVNRNYMNIILEYIFVIIVICENYSMVTRDISLGISGAMLIVIFCFASIGMIFVCKEGVYIKFSPKRLFDYLLLIAMSVLVVITPGANSRRAFIYWLVPTVCCGLCFLLKNEKEKMLMRYVNVVVLLAIASLFFYILGSMLHIIPPSRGAVYLYSEKYKMCNTYYGLLYEAQKIQGNTFFSSVYRNCGIFIEAPMYNLVLCLALAVELTFSIKPRKYIILILCTTILSTFSTTGIIFLIGMLGVYIYSMENSKIWKVLKLLIVPGAIWGIGYLIYEVIEMKIQSASGGHSYSVRLDHLIASIEMWLDKPLLGHGYGNNESFYKYTYYDGGYSVGLPILLGRTGILIFSIYIIPWIKNVLYSIVHKKRNLYFWIGSFILFFFTASVYKTIFIFILCIQLMWEDKESNPL